MRTERITLVAAPLLASALLVTGCSRHDGGMADEPATPVITSTSAFADFQGGWTRMEDGRPVYLGIRGDRCVEARGTQQVLCFMTMRNANIFRTVAYTMAPRQESMRIEGDELIIDMATPRPGQAGVVVYQRMSAFPAMADPTPFELGTRQPSDAELEALQTELVERREKEQAVRVEYQEAMEAAQARLSSSDMDMNAMANDPDVTAVVERMNRIDAENTTRLIGLMRDVGWIDAERFGEDANNAAFLIVQHSSNLQLMQTALPLIEASLDDHPEQGPQYALLFDRMRLALGGKQRYGTQLWGSPAGVRLSRLEDADRVESHRAAVGLDSLESYLQRIEEAYNTTVIRD